MSDSTIHDLPAASSVAATDVVPIDQGLVTRKATMTQVSAAVGPINVGVGIHGANSITTPVDADELGIVDTSDGNTLKKWTWANVKATLAALTSTWNISTTGNAGSTTKFQTARNLDATSFDGTANVTIVAPGIHAATNKATPVDADEAGIWDSVSGLLNKVTWANIKTTLTTYFDGIYVSLTNLAASGGSALVGFLQAGTGAVARTVQSKLHDTINMAEFLPDGYVTDGSVDYTIAIQNAIDYAASVRAKLVAPFGIFKGNWIIPSEISIEGVSIYGTIFKPTINAPVFSISSSVSTVRVNFSKFWIIGDLTMNAQDGIDLHPVATSTFADHIRISEVWISACGRYGLHTFGSSSAGPLVQALRIDSCYIAGCAQEGLYCEGESFEFVFTDFWCVDNGSNTIPNCTLGSKTSADSGPNRITWIGGGINQATVATNARYVSDLVTTATSATATSATANFVAGDAGKYIAIANGNSFGQPIITTIQTVSNSTTVILTDVVNVTNAGGTKAIINLAIGGAVNIPAAKQIKFIGIDFENAGVFCIVSGALTQNISFDSCNFASFAPVFATVWSKGGGNGLSVKNYNVTNTVAHFYNFLSADATGGIIALSAQLQNVDFPATSIASLTSTVKHIQMFDFNNLSANMTLYQPAMQTMRVNGNGTINNIFDVNGTTTLLTHGQLVYVYASSAGGIVMAHRAGGTGNIWLNSETNESIPGGGVMLLQWDTVSGGGLWFERSLTRKYGTFTMAAANTKTIADTNVGTTSVITLMPTNAAAATLMQGASSLYVSARTAQTSFAVNTADGSSAAGSETFEYVLM